MLVLIDIWVKIYKKKRNQKSAKHWFYRICILIKMVLNKSFLQNYNFLKSSTFSWKFKRLLLGLESNLKSRDGLGLVAELLEGQRKK